VASGDDPREHVRRNRAAWNSYAPDFVADGERSWFERDPRWGIWGVPEADLRVLPDVAGRDTIELGCGTAYFSAWLARRGARAVGIDGSPAQLATARRMQREIGPSFPLVLASAEEVPLPAARFDLALSEYGACLWCDPERWVGEAARLLRPGGRLVFLTNAAILMLCQSAVDGETAGDRLVRDYFRPPRLEWGTDASVEFHLGHAGWIRRLRANGFEVEDLIEVRPAENARTRYSFVSLDWARRWPSEEIWKARKRV
jgi:SAM-dependent methyltransferase